MIIYILLIYVILILFFLPKTERFITVKQMKRPFLNLYSRKNKPRKSRVNNNKYYFYYSSFYPRNLY